VAAKFAVCDDRQAVVLLLPNDVADGFILSFLELLLSRLAAVVAGENLFQLFRANQAADVIDANSV